MNHRPARSSLIASLVMVLSLTACPGGDQPVTPPAPQPFTQSHPGYAPGRSGVVKTVQVNGKTFQYEVIDGLAIHQGDIILGKAEDVFKGFLKLQARGVSVVWGDQRGTWTSSANASKDRSSVHLTPQGIICDLSIDTGFGWFCGRWGDGTVPYSFQDDWGSTENNAAMRSTIRAAMQHWAQRTNLRFVEASGGVRMRFRNSGGCSSNVGRQENIFGEPQDVNLNFPRCGLSQAIHEIGHALGLFHEQARADRDSFVRIHPENIEPGQEHNFGKEDIIGNGVGSYDYGSVMHYGCDTMSRNGLPTIEILTPGVTCADIGRGEASDGDILSVYTMYPPSFSITGITEGQSFPRDRNIYPSLEFAVRDPFKPEFIKWTRSGSSATIATGKNLNLNLTPLPVGTNTLTARLEVRGVTVASRSVNINLTNIPPNVTVQQPLDAATYCANEAIPFRALVSDLDGTVASSDIVWSTPTNPNLGTGLEISRSFTGGPQTVTVTVTDNNGGVRTATVTVNITTCTNPTPAVQITAPATDLDVYQQGAGYYEVTLTGNANVSGTPITGSSLVWTTDRGDLQPGAPATGAQQLGTGGSVTVRLYTDFCSNQTANAGVQIITLTATSPAGVSRSVTRRILIEALC
jgi:Astacin (Peptidase family M12A)